jgi:AcrR family transcriptional regulator
MSERARVPKVRAPKRLLAPEAERALTTRQLEILDALEDSVMVESLTGVTMAEIAKRMNCSLRTLYGIAPSKDELVMAVVDRRLHRIGREAIKALELEGSPLTRLRAYLRAANQAVQPTTAAFSRDFASDPAARRMVGSHGAYVIAITQALLDEAVESGEISAMDTTAVAHILGGLGSEFSRPDVEEIVQGSPKDAADFVAEIILAGLQAV